MPDGPTRRSAAAVVLEVVVILAGLLVAFQLGSRSAKPDGVYQGEPDTVPATMLGLPEGVDRPADQPGWVKPSKVVVADFWPGRTAELGRAVPGLEVVVPTSDSMLLAEIEDADGLMGALTADLWRRAGRLRWVQLPSAGVERYLAVPGFRESSVTLTNAQRIYAEGGAEHVMALVLGLARRLPVALAQQREGRWEEAPLTGDSPYSGAGSVLRELRGRTLLVAGLGGIGTEVARLASGIGMRVTATRASGRPGPPFVSYVGGADELLRLAGEADVVVNVLPLTDGTARTFDAAFFSAVKPGALFINIGRGRTVDTDALLAALRDGRLAGAGLDVTDPEPLPADHPLWRLPNVIITPHIGGDSDGHMGRMWLLFEENLRRFAAGDRLLSVVNKTRGY